MRRRAALVLNRSTKASTLWMSGRKTLHELALQLPETTFETWVRDTSLIDYRDGEFIIGAPHAYARDWLQNRLREKISRILNQLTRRSVQVNFEVRPQTRRRSEPSEPAPLYAEVPTDRARNDGVQNRHPRLGGGRRCRAPGNVIA